MCFSVNGTAVKIFASKFVVVMEIVKIEEIPKGSIMWHTKYM